MRWRLVYNQLAGHWLALGYKAGFEQAIDVMEERVGSIKNTNFKSCDGGDWDDEEDEDEDDDIVEDVEFGKVSRPIGDLWNECDL